MEHPSLCAVPRAAAGPWQRFGRTAQRWSPSRLISARRRKANGCIGCWRNSGCRVCGVRGARDIAARPRTQPSRRMRPGFRRSTLVGGQRRPPCAGSATRIPAGVRLLRQTEPSGSRTSCGPCRSGSSTMCCCTSWRTCWSPGTTPRSGVSWRPTPRRSGQRPSSKALRSPPRGAWHRTPTRQAAMQT